MPSVTIVKVKIRRGSDDQRKAIILEEGELGYTTDTKRLFIGDGITPGGLAVAPKIYTPLSKTYSITGVTASIGEIVPAGSLIYQLTSTDYTSLSSWVNISTKPDDVTLEYTGTESKVLSLKSNAVGGNSFNSTAAYEFGGITATTSNGLSANVDGTYVLLSSNKTTISPISADKISSQAIGNGLLGGNGSKISINAGPGFAFDSTTKFLKLTSLPSKIADIDSIDTATIYGDGLSLDNDDKLILDKDNLLGYGLTLNGSNKIAINGGSLTVPGSGISFDSNLPGLYINFNPVIGDGLSVNSTSGKLQANIPVTDNDSLVTTTGGLGQSIFSIADTGVEEGILGLPTISYNAKGQLINAYSSFTDVLTASNTGAISAFNGAPNQISNNYPRTNQTLINTISTYLNGGGGTITRTVQLTSAGFITLEQNSTQSSGVINRFAIPIFTY
jgi:hypothetical protein